MIKFHKIWIDQCKAAREIRDAFGTEKAIDYLIGEKLVTYAGALDDRPEFAEELPRFVSEVRRIFSTYQIHNYLQNPKCLPENKGFLDRVTELRLQPRIQQETVLAC